MDHSDAMESGARPEVSPDRPAYADTMLSAIDPIITTALAQFLPVPAWTALPWGICEFYQDGSDDGSPRGGLLWLQLFHPSERELVANIFNDRARHGEKRSLLVRVRGRHGHRWHRLLAEAISAEGGRVLRWVGATLECDAAVRETMARGWRSRVDRLCSKSDGSAARRLDALCRLSVELVAESMHVLCDEEGLRRSACRHDHLAALGEGAHARELQERATASGEPQWADIDQTEGLAEGGERVALFVAPVEPGERIAGMEGAAVSMLLPAAQDPELSLDIVRTAAATAARLMEQAGRKERDPTFLLSSLVHELRAVASPFAMVLDALETAPLEEGQRWLVELARRGLAQQQRLLDDALDVSAAGSGWQRLSLRRVDLEAILREVIELQRSRMIPRDIDLSLTILAPHRTIAADPLRLQQVITNLLTNAITNSPDGGRVDVEIDAEPATLVLRLCNPLPPGRERSAEILLEPFVRGPESNGLGLGLTITRTLVELHGGTLDVSCTADARFVAVVRLPQQRPD